jgi:hypothetical protein
MAVQTEATAGVLRMSPKPLNPKKPSIVKQISPSSFGEKAQPISRIEKSWIIFYAGCIIITQDMPITMGLTMLLLLLSALGEILWNKITTKPSKNTA